MNRRYVVRGRRRLAPGFGLALLMVSLLVGAAPVAAGSGSTAYLVKDILTQPVAGGSHPGDLTDAAGVLFFTALGAGGRELYRSDGTASGTVRLNIRPGAKGSNPAEITAIGSRVYFSANDGASGRELWTSDGTAAGTRRVKDIKPGSTGSSPRGLAVMSGRLFFSASDGIRGRELWVSDGTAQGTRLVRDIKAGSKGSDPRELVPVGNRLFFSALSGRTLWVSDGSSAGTVAFPNAADWGDVRQLTRAGTRLYFLASVLHPFYGYMPRPWLRVIVSGATSSTKLIRLPECGANTTYCEEPAIARSVGSTLYFTSFSRLTDEEGDVLSSSNELWRTDGTKAGTIKLTNLADCGSQPGRYAECIYSGAFAAVSGRLFFMMPRYAYSAQADRYLPVSTEVWKSDGTTAGTGVVKVFQQPFTGWGAAAALAGRYHFVGYVPETGFEPWESDGTEAGTMLAYDINPSGGWASPHHIARSGNSLYMSADDGVHGHELWRYIP